MLAKLFQAKMIIYSACIVLFRFLVATLRNWYVSKASLLIRRCALVFIGCSVILEDVTASRKRMYVHVLFGSIC